MEDSLDFLTINWLQLHMHLFYWPTFCPFSRTGSFIIFQSISVQLREEKSCFKGNLVCVGNTIVGRGDRKKGLGELGVCRKCLEVTLHCLCLAQETSSPEVFKSVEMSCRFV